MTIPDGKIAAILSRTRVVINRGRKDGVGEGDHFVIYTELGPFFDPDTKENLGVTKDVWGKVIVRTVEERFCLADTEFETRGPLFEPYVLANIFGARTEQIKLPVNEEQIQKGLSKIEVGFLARLVKAARREKKVQTVAPKKELPPAKAETDNSLSGNPKELKSGEDE